MYKMLWVPDLIFSNEKKGGFHTLTTDNRLLKLKESGEGSIFFDKTLFKIILQFIRRSEFLSHLDVT